MLLNFFKFCGALPNLNNSSATILPSSKGVAVTGEIILLNPHGQALYLEQEIVHRYLKKLTIIFL